MLHQLERAYRNELNFADLFPFEEQLIEEAVEKVTELQQKIAHFQSTSAQETEDAAWGEKTASSSQKASPLIIGVMKSSLLRTNWLVAAYLQLRMEKIQSHYPHILSQMHKYQSYLSECEHEFLNSFASLTDSLVYSNSKLSGVIPAEPSKVHQRLFEYSTAPFVDQCVFVKNPLTGETSAVAGLSPELAADVMNKRVYLL